MTHDTWCYYSLQATEKLIAALAVVGAAAWQSWSHLKGLQRQRLIGSAVAGFNQAKTIRKTSATSLDARPDDYNKGIGSPGSLVSNPVRWDSLDASFTLKGQVIFDFSNVTKWQIFF